MYINISLGWGKEGGGLTVSGRIDRVLRCKGRRRRDLGSIEWLQVRCWIRRLGFHDAF